jgi:hypothetical protein
LIDSPCLLKTQLVLAYLPIESSAGVVVPGTRPAAGETDLPLLRYELWQWEATAMFSVIFEVHPKQEKFDLVNDHIDVCGELPNSAVRNSEYAPTRASSEKLLLRPLGLGRTQAIVPANPVTCWPDSTSGLPTMVDKARFPRKAIRTRSITPNLGFKPAPSLLEFFRRTIHPPAWSVGERRW